MWVKEYIFDHLIGNVLIAFNILKVFVTNILVETEQILIFHVHVESTQQCG